VKRGEKARERVLGEGAVGESAGSESREKVPGRECRAINARGEGAGGMSK
jgi:hypothetical protein